MAVVTESALIYTLAPYRSMNPISNLRRIWGILFFVTEVKQPGRNLERFFSITWAGISAFSAFLINMRAGLGWAKTSTQLPITHPVLTNGMVFVDSTISTSVPIQRHRQPLSTIEIHLAQETTTLGYTDV